MKTYTYHMVYAHSRGWGSTVVTRTTPLTTNEALESVQQFLNEHTGTAVCITNWILLEDENVQIPQQ